MRVEKGELIYGCLAIVRHGRRGTRDEAVGPDGPHLRQHGRMGLAIDLAWPFSAVLSSNVTGAFSPLFLSEPLR